VWGFLRSPVPDRHRVDLAFGLLVLVLFLIQVGTGILLTLYFQPSPAMVAESVQYIMRDVSFGWLVRGTHHWSAQALVAVGIVQVARIFVRGLYRTAGASVWYCGASVLALLAMLAFSGEILAWDDLAYWRFSRVVHDVESLPALGPSLARMLRGGDEIGATTLSRTYSAHTMFLPWTVWMLILLDTWLLARRMRSSSGGSA
jgi:quinol-cytochrome oxidoreductase complex cytochrome b subunit